MFPFLNFPPKPNLMKVFCTDYRNNISKKAKKKLKKRTACMENKSIQHKIIEIIFMVLDLLSLNLNI